MLCPRCNKQRQPRERLEHKDGKAWLIEFCHHCKYNFEITEWEGPKKPTEEDKAAKYKRLKSWFKEGPELT